MHAPQQRERVFLSCERDERGVLQEGGRGGAALHVHMHLYTVMFFHKSKGNNKNIKREGDKCRKGESQEKKQENTKNQTLED